MCSYQSFRPVPTEDNPVPRPAIDIYRQSLRRQRAMEGHGTSTGSDLMEDVIR
jgi:hypothetical protein